MASLVAGAFGACRWADLTVGRARAQELMAAGYLAGEDGNHVLAEQAFLTAAHFARQASSPLAEAEALRNLAWARLQLGRAGEGLRPALRSAQLAGAAKNAVARGKALVVVATVARDLRDATLARDAVKGLPEMFATAGDWEWAARADAEAGHIAYMDGAYEAAYVHFARAYVRSLKAGAAADAAEDLLDAASAAEALGDRALARRLYSETWQIVSGFPGANAQYIRLVAQAELAGIGGDSKARKALLRDALELAESNSWYGRRNAIAHNLNLPSSERPASQGPGGG